MIPSKLDLGHVRSAAVEQLLWEGERVRVRGG